MIKPGVLAQLRQDIGIAPRVELRKPVSTTSGSDPGGAQDPDLPPDLTVLPRGHNAYQVLGEVARGGMASIIAARDPDLRREIAVKVLHPKCMRDPNVVKRFVEEAQISGQLQHPGIVPVYELGLLADHRPYFTMKLVRGKSLQQILHESEGTADERMRHLGIFQQVCQAMAYSHSRGVVHRDLKPENIMVGVFGEVQVVDWGIAKVLSRSDKREGTARGPDSDAAVDLSGTDDHPLRQQGEPAKSIPGTVMGTPDYMAPEQARGEVDKVDARSDVFALGGILCEILTGKPPFFDSGHRMVQDSAEGNLAGALERLGASDADEKLVSLARACLSADRENRPADAGIVALHVSAYLASIEDRARNAMVEAAEARGRADSERKARQLTVWLAAVVIGALLLTLAGIFWVEGARRQRAVLAERDVAATIREANRLRGQAAFDPPEQLERWQSAVDLARRAVRLAEAGADAAVVERARSLLAELEGELEGAIQRADRSRRNRAFEDQIDELRASRTVELDWNGTEPAFAECFRNLGIDAEQLSTDEASQIAIATLIPEEIAIGLDAWIRARWQPQSRSAPDVSRLIALALRIDPDPWRSSIRGSLQENAPERLHEIATGTGLELRASSDQVMLARYLECVGDRARAVEIYLRAVAAHPEDFWLNLNLAFLLGRLETPDLIGSLRYATAAVALRPRDPAARASAGLALSRMGDADGALEKFLEATRLDPQYPQAWLLVADAHLQRGELEPAIAACTRAIAIDAGFADAHLELALATMAAGRPRDAIEHLDAAERTGTNDAAWQQKLAAARASCNSMLER